MDANNIDDPILPDVQARIRQAFMLGLARQPLAVPPSLAPLLGSLSPAADPALALLALAGQRQRFVRPDLPPLEPVPEAARRLHEDPRPVLAPPARRALARLAGSVEKAHASGVLSIAVRRIAEAGWRLHPFDLPDLAPHIKSDSAGLGLAERSYLALTASDADEDAAKSLFYDTITIDNWTTFPKSQRRAFVVELRRTDAAAGRALVESVWKTEPAPVRLTLLEALGVGLGPDDKPFLEKLATDRADTVKQAAAQLLARMPSSEGYAARLVEAARCFERPSKSAVGGLMSAIGLGSDALVFKLPGDAKNWADMQAARDRLFGGMSLSALTGAVGAPPDKIIAALPADDHHILFLLLDTALTDGDTATARTIIASRLLSGSIPHGHFLMQLVEKCRFTLSPEEATRLIVSPAWRDLIGAYAQAATPAAMKDDGRLIFTAALIPHATTPAFKDTLAPLTPVSARAARDFADLVLALPPTPPSPAA
ncbi:MAG: DUF5691 domain-containing protein [Hyphomicrobiaceae bacterium]